MFQYMFFFLQCIADLVICKKKKIGIPRSNSVGTVSQCLTNVPDHMPNSEEAIRRGEYTVIRSLIRVLEVLI